MTQIYTITNQKGGIGKSTTAQNIGAGLNRLYKKKVLLIDLDPQENLSLATGCRKSKANILEVLRENIPVEDTIQTIREGLDIIPSSIDLYNADKEFAGAIAGGKKLKRGIAPIKDKYDYIIIDTPPALGVLTVNALTVADRVVIPAQADLFSLEAIKQLRTTMGLIIETEENAKLKVEGILLTRYSPRSIISQEIKELIDKTAGTMQTKIFSRPIREAVAIKEAQASHTDIFEYAPESKVAGDYKHLIEELLSTENKGAQE